MKRISLTTDESEALDTALIEFGGVVTFDQLSSLFDEDHKLGLAGFTGDTLMRGTAKRTYQEIYDTLESAGASLQINGGTHTTGFGSKALVEDLDLLLGL